LRSDRGEMLRPAGRGPFATYDEFKRSTEVGYWLEQFLDATGRLEAFNELGKRIVSEVCVEQSSKELRVSNGPKLLFDKREHVSPLALCLHEIKLWAAAVLPVLSPGDPATHHKLMQRVKYLVCLCPRDVWCSGGRLTGKGLSGAVHARLVTLIQRVIMFLTQAAKLEFKRYCQRQAHRKLGMLLHGVRAVVAMSAALMSCLASVDEPAGPKLDVADLVDAGAVKESRAGFANLATVSLYFTLKAPLLRGGLASDYMAVAADDAPALIKGWAAANPWAKRGALSPAPDFIASAAYPPMPNAYSAAYDVLYADLRGAARHVVWPVSLKSMTARWKAVFADVKDLAEAVRAVQAHLAALYDLAPSLYAVHRLWELSADDDVMLLEFLRPQALRVMGDALLRLCNVRAAELSALAAFTDLAGKQLAAQGKLEEAAQLLYNGAGVRREPQKAPPGKSAKAKPLPDPTFLRNLDHAASELTSLNEQAFGSVFHLAQEISRDVFDYTFGAPLVATRGAANQPPPPPKARSIMQLCESLLTIRAEDYHGAFNLTRVSSAIGADWLLLRKHYAAALAEVSANAFEDVSEAAAFKARDDESQRELENILAGNAGHADVADVPDVIIDDVADDDDAASTATGGSSTAAGARKKSLFGRLVSSGKSGSADAPAPMPAKQAAAAPTKQAAAAPTKQAAAAPKATKR